METQKDNDISREGLKFSKIVQFFRLCSIKNSTQVLGSVEKFEQIDFENLFAIGKRGVILDVDDTLAPNHGEIPKEIIEIISHKLKKFKIVVFSNMKKNERYSELEKVGITVITSKYAKPDIRGFAECLQHLGLESAQVVAIGDNFLTDGGAKNIGIDFIKVTPIRDKNEKLTFKRKIHIAIQDFIDKIALNRGHI